MERVITVIDLKAFYAYVECVDRGIDPWKSPLVVCDKERGSNTIILSVSPYLKARGVPSRLRFKELPKGFDYIYALPRMERYIQMSGEVVKVFLDFFSGSDIHVYSIDESFIDLTSYISYYKKSGLEIVEMVKEEIKKRTGLQATAGIGDNFFLAKVALDIFAKHAPNGIGILHKEDVETKLWPITPLKEIWGIGERLQLRLNQMGIYKVEELAKADRLMIANELGIMGDQLVDHANGIDNSDIHEIYIPEETSLTIGQTLARNYSMTEVPIILREMNDDLCMKLRSQEETTKVIHLFIGYASDQGGFSHQMALDRPTNDTDTIYKAIMIIYNKYIVDKPIRQISIVFGKLRPINNTEQLDLFESIEEIDNMRNLNKVLDELRFKYGKDTVLRASALTDESTALDRHALIGGHRK